MNSLQTNSNIYKPNQIQEVLKLIGNIELIRTNKKTSYYNIPISFDIETSSFYQSTQVDSKVAIMYIWSFNINGITIIGRTWSEFIHMLEEISMYYTLTTNTIMIIYVHNLSYEFQFLRKRLDWEAVFSLSNREPVRALCELGFEFRCSYILSGYSLSNLSKQLQKYKCDKLVGDLDYSPIRHSTTTITNKELGYIINDTKIVVYYIQELIERLGDITKIPLTKTGFVRKYCRDMCFYDTKDHKKDTKKYHKYRELMKSLTITPQIYQQLKRAFQGGFTHCSALYSGTTVYNIDSFDFTSSYPYVMVSEMFPMSKGEYIQIKSKEELKHNLTSYCCLFDVEFTEIYALTMFENYISKSKCYEKEELEENNGRVVNAKRIKITITEQDYFIIRKMYNWKTMKISNFIRFRKDYLPTDFVYSILKLYKDKTELKGVEGKEVEYMNSKEMVNSCYGMMVTDICRDEIIYNDDWCKEEPNIEEAVDKYNKSVKRFLYYPWGVWVTAYARRNLFTGILTYQNNYIYSDTDSIKVMNMSTQVDYINAYNKSVEIRLEKAMKHHNLPISLCKPKNLKGEIKTLGIWECETKHFKYTKFKSLGAKRYLYEQNNELHLTVSGLNKKIAIPYLKQNYPNRVFEKFDDGLYIPAAYTGKMTHTYIDEEKEGFVYDYNGKKGYYNELSCVHLENTDYTLSIATQYADFLLGIKLKEK